MDDLKENSYQPRHRRADEKEIEGKKWLLPLAILLILVTIIGVFWYLGNRYQISLSGLLSSVFDSGEEMHQVTIPEALLSLELVEDLVTNTINREDVELLEEADENTISYVVPVNVKNELIAEAGKHLESTLSTLYDPNRRPFLFDLGYDGDYTDFHLVIDQDEEQDDQALITASELFLLAVYYHLLSSADESVSEISVTVEDHETGYILDEMRYPDHINRAASVLKNLNELADTPKTPQAGDRVIVATGTDNLNLRNGPEITYLIIDILTSGTILEVKDVEGAWLEVITPQGREGWVHGSFVELHPGDD